MDRTNSTGPRWPTTAPPALRRGGLWQELLTVTAASVGFCSLLSLVIVWWLRA